jgi:hypothetical protein
MAYIATINIVVDETEEARLYDGINEMLRTAQEPVEEDGAPWIVDWAFTSVEHVNEALNDAICNATYAEGDAFRDWVIFSRSEAIAQDGAGFWSNEYGWTTLDLATKFDAIKRELPHSAGMDAVWMLAPYRMNFFRLILVEYPEDADLDQTPIAFDCWAESFAHAVEQAANAYPGCTILGQEGDEHE